MNFHFSNIHLAGIVGVVMKNRLSLHDRLSQAKYSYCERIATYTGIHDFSIADAQTSLTDLFFFAAEHLLNTLSIKAGAIDAVIVVTQTPDYICPATSAILQSRLKLSKRTLAFDIHHGCSGYIYGLLQAALLLQNGCQHILLCVGDIISPYLSISDHATQALFSDGASATLLSKGSHSMRFLMKTNGNGLPHLYCPQPKPSPYNQQHAYLSMNGMHVMRFVLDNIPRLIHDLLKMQQWTTDTLELLLLHQANALILEQLRKILIMPMNKMPLFLKHIGNTGGASIPILLSGLIQTKNQVLHCERTIACGFGVGWSYGAASLSLKDTRILPLLDYI